MQHTANTPSGRVRIAFSALQSTALEVNQQSDELTAVVKEINDGLKELNLGIECWVRASLLQDEAEEFYEAHDLGYAKIKGKWCVAIKVTSGQVDGPRESDEWAFWDAPRPLRIETIEKLPELMERLSLDASEAVTKLRSSIAAAREVTKAISGAKDAESAKTADELKKAIASLKNPQGGK